MKKVTFFTLFQTVNTVLWYLHEVSKSENLQNKMRENFSNDSDLESPLIRGGLRETLRLFPVACFIGRFLDREANFGSYTIPKGWLVLLSLYTSGRDAANFSNPLKFSPDRWLRKENKTEDKVLKSYATIPFALGGRSCVGKKIATYQVHCLMTKVNLREI